MNKLLCVLLAAVMLLPCAMVASAEDVALEITTQPTVTSPTVEVSDESAVASYQWQSLGAFAEGEITDANGATLTLDEMIDEETEIPSYATLTPLVSESSYDSENGWSPASMLMHADIDESSFDIYAYIYFSAYLEKDSSIVVNFSAAPSSDIVSLVNLSTEIDSAMDFSDDGLSALGIVEESGFYAVIFISPVLEDISVQGFASAVASFENIEGETASTLSTVEAGNVYRCAVTASDDSVLYSEAFDAEYEILSQPTAGNPTVEVTFEEDASFQWYEIVMDSLVVDDAMVAPDYESLGTYDAETQLWTPFYDEPYDYYDYQEYKVYLCYLEINKGETVRITLSNPDAISPMDPELRFSGVSTETEFVLFENGVVEFTATETDVYELYHFGIYPETATYTIEMVDYTYAELEGETEKTLQNPDLAKTYAVVASYEDGAELVSEKFEMEYAITKQPTAEEPTVEVNFSEDVASYQWYKQIVVDVPVTDENATISSYSSSENIGYYDSENSYWVPSLYARYTDEDGIEYYEYDLFYLTLNAGDTLYITPSAELKYGDFETWEELAGETYDDFWVYEDGVYSFVAPTDGEYWLYTYTYDIDITFEASVKTYAFTETVEGETEKTFSSNVSGEYLCVVTYENGTELISDSITVEATYLVGDVNADGAVDQYDYLLVKRAYFETYTLDEEESVRADVDYSRVVDQYDYMLIKRAYFGTYTIEQK